jgi:hypothetical protein
MRERCGAKARQSYHLKGDITVNTYQSLLAISLMPDPYRVHPQRHLLSLGADAQDLVAQG